MYMHRWEDNLIHCFKMHVRGIFPVFYAMPKINIVYLMKYDLFWFASRRSSKATILKVHACDYESENGTNRQC